VRKLALEDLAQNHKTGFLDQIQNNKNVVLEAARKLIEENKSKEVASNQHKKPEISKLKKKAFKKIKKALSIPKKLKKKFIRKGFH
jgi:hypothetical protein